MNKRLTLNEILKLAGKVKIWMPSGRGTSAYRGYVEDVSVTIAQKSSYPNIAVKSGDCVVGEVHLYRFNHDKRVEALYQTVQRSYEQMTDAEREAAMLRDEERRAKALARARELIK